MAGAFNELHPEATLPPSVYVAIITEAIALIQKCRRRQTPAQALSRIQYPSVIDRRLINRMIRRHAPGREADVFPGIVEHAKSMSVQEMNEMMTDEEQS